jgi:murein DD-endopeptidase MepM/ murein hydrolase activator NlpD
MASLMFLCLLIVAQVAAQVTVYYQPTPYPEFKWCQQGYSCPAMPQDLNIVHLWDGWITNVFYNKAFIRDEKLQIGGWGDNYRTYVRFDLTGLPSSVNSAYLGLYSYPRGDGSALVYFDMWRPTTEWNLGMSWNTQPGYSYISSWATGSTNGFWWINTTSVYNGWKNGSIPNYGLTLMPWTQNNNFDVWRSSRYIANDGQRPVLALNFTPSLQLKMPLPGNHSWLTTTESGGYDCLAKYPTYWPDSAHQGTNHFSVDWSWRNVPDSGATVYTEASNIPVLAAAGGRVVFARGGTTAGNPNGYYVVLDHDYDGNLSTGFSTRYLHLKYSPSVSEGINVAQGALLGYMGSTGRDANGNPTSTATHLHFGVRYRDSGASSVNELAKVVMDGWIIKSVQTECWINANGVPTDYKRYYRSGNNVY